MDWTKAVRSRPLHCAYEGIVGAMSPANDEKKWIQCAVTMHTVESTGGDEHSINLCYNEE